jgi:hypothetical protein
LDLEELKTVELADGELAKQRLQVGDVLFNRTNSRELVGKTGMWDGRLEAVPASYFIRIRFRAHAEHPQHFTTFMNLPSMKRRLAEMARGAVGQANINSRELKSIEFPVPPIKLQYEFAARVSEIRSMQVEQAASQRYRRTIIEQFFPSRGFGKLKLAEARKAIRDYRRATGHLAGTIDLMLTYVENGTQFTREFGDINEAYYKSLESVLYEMTQLLRKEDPSLYPEFRERIQRLGDHADYIGWGYGDHLRDQVHLLERELANE